MKVAQPQLAPIPERKPEPPVQGALASTFAPVGAPVGASAGGSSFRETLAQAQPLAGKPVPVGRLSNGQKAPPVPGEKPEPPMLLADGTRVPLPVRKPEAKDTAVAAKASGNAASIVASAVANASADPASANPAARRVVLAAQQVAGLSGHSYAAILAQATQESGLNPAARNRTSSAAGPFQFLERTWLDLFRRHGAAYGHGELASAIESRNGIPSVKDPAARQKILDLRHDVDVSAGMAARYLAEGRERLSQRLHRPVSETESRIAYVMGVGGAAKLIRAAESSPSALAADVLPSAAKANRNLFYDRASGRALTASETVGRLTRRMESDQKEMFALMARAAEPPQRLDGGTSPLGAFQAAALGDTVGDGAGASAGAVA